jgi:cysteine synthase A
MALKSRHCRLFAKLEYNNFSGSSKDRAAYSILRGAVLTGKVNRDTTIVASSSGNLAIALGSLCKMLKIKFIPIIDPNINRAYEGLLNLLSYKVVKVTERDATGGFLMTRIAVADELCASIDNSFCADQYTDPNNYRGYFALADEVIERLGVVDHIFIPVSSGGAITGISSRIREKGVNTRIIGVDVEGSVIFGHPPERRYVSGIGSSITPPILEDADIDEVILVKQSEIITGCHSLLEEQVIFCGASSGAVYFAAKGYFESNVHAGEATAVLLFPDRGGAYLDTIYNKEWAEKLSKLTINAKL